MNKAMFSDAKVKIGNKVWDASKGWGEVIETDEGDTLNLKVKFKDCKAYRDTAWFTNEGVKEDGLLQTLFHDEVKIVPPERPKEHHHVFKDNIIRIEHRAYGRCECGEEGLQQIDVEHNYQAMVCGELPKPKEECEACELIEAMKDVYDPVSSCLKKDLFLLNQHHTCEKKDA